MMKRFCFITLSLLPLLLSAKDKTIIRPDYSQEKFWIALPTRHDIGDTIAPGCTIPEDQANAKADVFYVHPTVYMSGSAWNADLGDAALNKKCDNCVQNQATGFNACGRIYAPRYRQGVFRCFTQPGPLADAALDTAYADVKKAFEYYLAHYNNGRPIIIASHSQGSRHTVRLLKEFFEGKPLMKQLVAAYSIGASVPKNYFTDIPVADSAGQTGCFITWNTVEWGTPMTYQEGRFNDCICVNPLSWKTDSLTYSYALHKGGIPFGFAKLEANVADTKIAGSLLWVRGGNGNELKGYGKLGKSYHVADMNLFYEDIRENAILRVKNYCAANNL